MTEKNTDAIENYFISIIKGFIYPSLPNGGWSITVEFHFYLILPLLLFFLDKSIWTAAYILIAALALRWFIYQEQGEIQNIAYFTIVGRIDQFILGMLAFHLSFLIKNKNLLMAITSLAFFIFYWKFDASGGFMHFPSYPSTNPIWMVMSTIEGLFFALFVAWYDNSFNHSRGITSRFFAAIGEYSYSIYLLHMFFVFSAAKLIHENIMDISNFYKALAWALVCFCLMLPIASISHRFIEKPFMKWRRLYTLSKRF